MTPKKYGGWVAVFLLAYFGMTVAPPALARPSGETLRVGVLFDQSSLIITSRGAIIIQNATRNEMARLRKSIEILSDGSDLLVNGQSLGLKTLRVRTDFPPLTLNGKAFTGTFRIDQGPRGLRVINELDLEEYLKGVVPVEISPLWHPEALKAQAIIARTYALYQRKVNANRDFDLVATTDDQVYTGRAHEHHASNQAIAETVGLVLWYEGNIVLSSYHSTSAGPTEAAHNVWGIDLPYLKGVECPFDRLSPRYQWVREVDFDRLQAALLRSGFPVGTIATLTPFDWTASGRVRRIRLLHSEGETVLRGEELRRSVGYSELPSTRFSVVQVGHRITIRGKGSGHGVGLCQWGTKTMAEMGYSFDKIIKFYYPGVEISAYSKSR